MVQKRPYTQITPAFLLVGQFSHRGQVGYGIPRGEQRQQIGRQKLGHFQHCPITTIQKISL